MKLIRESRLYPLSDSQGSEYKGLRNQKLGNSPTLSNVHSLPINSNPPLDLQHITLVEESYDVKCQREIAQKNQQAILFTLCNCITCGLSAFILPVFRNCWKGE